MECMSVDEAELKELNANYARFFEIQIFSVFFFTLFYFNSEEEQQQKHLNFDVRQKIHVIYSTKISP